MISKVLSLRTSLSVWALCFLLGLIAGGVPLLAARFSTEGLDPFDLRVSYLVWGGGLFFSAMIIGFLRSERPWRWGLAVGSGLPTAAIAEIVVDVARGSGTHTLWPLTIILTVFIAVPPAFAGAYFGVLLKRIFTRNSREKVSDSR